MTDTHDQQQHDTNAFNDEANAERVGLFTELWEFLKDNKKWWMLPILICFAGLIGLVILAAVAPGAAPFIYTLH